MRPSLPFRPFSTVPFLFVVGLSAVAPETTAAQTADVEVGPVFTVEALAPGVYAGLVLPRPDAYAFANSLIVVGDDGVLVVDTQQSPRAARAMIAHIRELTDLPVRWVVNTHWHGDHVYGNVAYRDAWPDVRFYGTPATVEGMRGPGVDMRMDELADLPGSIADRERWLEEGRLPDGRELTHEFREQVAYSLRMRSVYLDELVDLELVEPDRLVDEPTRLDLGGRSVTLVPLGPAHTDGDLVVHVPDAGVVAVGDLLEEAAPWIDGAYLSGWARALETIQSMDPTLVLPAHGGVSPDRVLLDGQAALFRTLTGFARVGVDSPTADAVAALVAALDEHRGFLATLGVEGAAFDRWVADAARQALDQARDER